MSKMTEVAVVDPKEFGLAKTEVEDLLGGLPTIRKEREALIKSYEDIIELEVTEENIPIFRELRLQIRDNRTKGILPWHKTKKQYFLNGGRFVDSIKNVEVEINERMEANLLKAEKYYENLELERLKQLQITRAEELSPYVEDAEERDLSSMDEDVWQAYLATKIKAHEVKIEQERLEEEAKLEKERVDNLRKEREDYLRPFFQFVPENHPDFGTLSSDEWEDFSAEMSNAKQAWDKKQAEIKAENERLKKEAEAREIKIAKERAAAKAKADKEAKIQAEKERKAKEEEDRLRAELQAEKERRKREEEERLAKLAEEKAEAERLAKAPIKDKLKAWVDSFDIDEVDVENEVVLEIVSKFGAFKKWSKKQIENL